MAILRRFSAASLVACALLIGAGTQAGASTKLSEAQLRAGFIYNFATFVEWPKAQAGDPLLVGVLGDDAVAFALRSMHGRVVNGRKIVTRTVDEADDLAATSLLYIGLDDDRLASAALARVAKAPVLTVGESTRFTQIGGIVRLYSEEAKLRFEINVARSQESNLRISSKLLGLAKIVKESK